MYAKSILLLAFLSTTACLGPEPTSGSEGGQAIATPAAAGATADDRATRSGGSAADGFTYKDSREADGPRFFWIDISASGQTFNSDSQLAYTFNSSMSFPFYGSSYSTFGIGRNGGISFDGNYTPGSNESIPNVLNQGVTQLIAAYWDKLRTDRGGAVYFEVRDQAPNRKLIVQWQDVNHPNSTDTVTFQAVLFESGNILMQYLDASLEAGVGATVGVQGSTTQGVQYSFDEAALTGGLAICFTPTGGDEDGCALDTGDGLQFTDSRQAGAPQFNWHDISATGTALGLGNNGEATIAPSGFSFRFPGTTSAYSAFTIGANGAINFAAANVPANNQAIPDDNGADANRFVALYWDDLAPNVGGEIYWQVLSDPERLVVQYNKVPHHNGDATDTVTAQALLFADSGNIALQYYNPSTEAGAGATIGVQDSASTGLQYAVDDAALSKQLAICIFEDGGQASDCSTGDWLSKRFTNTDGAADYYQNIDGNDEFTTFADWKDFFGFDGTDEYNAKYYNNFDLGLGRDMYCRTGTDQYGEAFTACYVTNYGIAPGGPANTALNHAISGTDPIATVCMMHRPDRGSVDGVQFVVYGADGIRLDRVALDSEGDKSIPQVCLPCHGGTYSDSSHSVTGSSFLPFDVFSYKFSTSDSNFSLAAQQEAFRIMNGMVKNTQPTQQIQDIIDGWYATTGGVGTTNAIATDDYVPSAWAEDEELYHKVVKTSCRGCHAAQGFDLSSPSMVYESSVCGNRTMPHTEKAYKNFWTDTQELHLPTYLAASQGWDSCLDNDADGPIPALFSQVRATSGGDLIDALLRTEGDAPELTFGTFDSANHSLVGAFGSGSYKLLMRLGGFSVASVSNTIIAESDKPLSVWNWYQASAIVPDQGSVWTNSGWAAVADVGLAAAALRNGRYYYRIQMADMLMTASLSAYIQSISPFTVRFFSY